MFPTPVGMNRSGMLRVISFLRVPHARGDEPQREASASTPTACSPRPWG